MKTILNQRDIELFRKLSIYGMLSTKQVGQVVFNSIAITTVLRRLRLLEAGFYVKRIRGLESQDVLWILTEKGAAMAEVEVPKRHWSKNMLEHDFKLLSLRLALESCGVVHDWTPEHAIRRDIFRRYNFKDAKRKLVPDGLVAIQVGGIKESIALELELTMKDSRRYQELFRRYSEKNNLQAIWYVVPTQGIMKHVWSNWKKVKSIYRVPHLYLSYLDEVLKDPLKTKLRSDKVISIGEIWERNPAHSPAQEVSSEVAKIEEEKIELSTQDHTPILKEVS